MRLVETQLDGIVKLVRSDMGGEFSSNALRMFFERKGIKHLTAPPAAHAQNGRVERAHLTIGNDIRTLLIDSKMGPDAWAKAAMYSVYVRNRVAGSGQSQSPESIWYGRDIQVGHLQPFGSQVFYRDHTVGSKLLPWYREGRLYGFNHGTSNYRIMDKETGKLAILQDAVFTNKMADWPTKPSDSIIPEQWEPVAGTIDAHLVNEDEDITPQANTTPEPTSITEPSPTDSEELSKSSTDVEPLVETPRGQSQLSEPMAAPTDGTRVPNFIGWVYEKEAPQPIEVEPLGRGLREKKAPVRYGLTATLCAALNASLDALNIPTTYNEARNSLEWPQWSEAMDEELAKMEKYRVWDQVPYEKQRVMTGKWVFTRKIDGETGRPSAYKARFVAQGSRQIEGKDYHELFASVVHKDSIRVFLAIVNHEDLECHQVNIKGAFLNGEIDADIWVKPPEGSNIPANQVLKLRKSLYGLKQSPRLFNQTLDRWLKSVGMTQCKTDECVYIRRRGNKVLMLLVHVDNQLIASNDLRELEDFKKQLNLKFECSDSGPVGYFLGFNIFRDQTKRELWISQEHYIEAILEKFGMSDCNTAKQPLWSTFKAQIATDKEFAAAKHLPFPQVAGALLYLSTITRPDIAYTASLLCRYISKWNDNHWQAAKHVLQYLRGTTDLGLKYDNHNSKQILLGYADADWGADLDTRRSTTGYVFKTFGGTVAWKSKRQSTIALSTTQAEILASTDAVKQAEWLRDFLSELGWGLPQGKPVPILNDNMGAIHLAKNPYNNTDNRHYAMRSGSIREKQAANIISLNHVPSEENEANALTKNVSKVQLEKFRERVGVKLKD